MRQPTFSKEFVDDGDGVSHEVPGEGGKHRVRLGSPLHVARDHCRQLALHLRQHSADP